MAGKSLHSAHRLSVNGEKQYQEQRQNVVGIFSAEGMQSKALTDREKIPQAWLEELGAKSEKIFGKRETYLINESRTCGYVTRNEE